MTEQRRNEPGRNSYPPTPPNDDPPGQESRQRTDTEGRNSNDGPEPPPQQLCWLQPRPPPSPQQQCSGHPPEPPSQQPEPWPLHPPPAPAFASTDSSSLTTDNAAAMTTVLPNDWYSQPQQQYPQQQQQQEYVFPQWTPLSPQSFEQYTVQPLQQQQQQQQQHWPEERATHTTTILEVALHGMQQRSQQLRTELEGGSGTSSAIPAITFAVPAFLEDVETTTDRRASFSAPANHHTRLFSPPPQQHQQQQHVSDISVVSNHNKNNDTRNNTRMTTHRFQKTKRKHTNPRVRLVSSNTTPSSTAIAATSSVAAAAAAKKKRNVEKQRRDDLNYQYTSLIQLVQRIEADDAYREQQQQQQQRTLADSHQKQNEKNEAVAANTQAQNAVEYTEATTRTITKQCARATVRAATQARHDFQQSFPASSWSPISAANRADVLARTVQHLQRFGLVYQQQHAIVQTLRHQLHSATQQTQTVIARLHEVEQTAAVCSSVQTTAALMAMRTQPPQQQQYPRVPAWMGPTLLLLPHHPHPPPLAFPTAAPAPTGTVSTIPSPYLLTTMPTTQFHNTILVSTTAAATAAPTRTTDSEMGTATVERKPEDDTSNT